MERVTPLWSVPGDTALSHYTNEYSSSHNNPTYAGFTVKIARRNAHADQVLCNGGWLSMTRQRNMQNRDTMRMLSH